MRSSPEMRLASRPPPAKSNSERAAKTSSMTSAVAVSVPASARAAVASTLAASEPVARAVAICATRAAASKNSGGVIWPSRSFARSADFSRRSAEWRAAVASGRRRKRNASSSSSTTPGTICARRNSGRCSSGVNDRRGPASSSGPRMSVVVGAGGVGAGSGAVGAATGFGAGVATGAFAPSTRRGAGSLMSVTYFSVSGSK